MSSATSRCWPGLAPSRWATNSMPTCWRAPATTRRPASTTRSPPCHNRKTSLKAALLDQRVVAGLGNIYVCEALFRSHLSPRRLAATLATKKGEPTDHSKRLVSSIHDVLNQAIKAGGSSISDHRLTSGELGYFQHSFQVYDREGERCQTAGCSGIVRRFVQNGRSTFWCPKCQKGPERREERSVSFGLALSGSERCRFRYRGARPSPEELW